MRRTITAACLAATAALTLAACSSATKVAGDDKAAAGTPAAAELTATTAFAGIAQTVKTAKLTQTVTAENDGNHLLGRPGQYTSKIGFADSRIKGADVSFYKTGDVELGGAIEVFPDAAGATARAKYIQAVTKSMPALAEYDFPHGTILVRVSRFLTPAQAGAYDRAAATLG